MKEIVPRLYVGGSEDALSIQLLTEYKVGLIVCAAKDHPTPFTQRIQYVYYPLVDDESDNVLQYVDDCYDRVSGALRANCGVLIHCQQGVSRSVALGAAYLMKRDLVEFRDAYSTFCQRYPAANIADNFARQLQEYGCILKWNVFGESQEHRLFRARNRITPHTNALPSAFDSTGRRYLCRKCRQSLFLENHLIPGTCPNYLVECMDWMDVEDRVSGSISCPGCEAKLGQFDWTGKTGDGEGPSFVITKSKVDPMPWTAKFNGLPYPRTKF